MVTGFDIKEYKRNHIGDKTVEWVETNILQRIEDLKSFASYSDKPGMEDRAIALEQSLKYWLMGIQGIIPEDFNKIIKGN